VVLNTPNDVIPRSGTKRNLLVLCDCGALGKKRFLTAKAVRNDIRKECEATSKARLAPGLP